MDLQRIKTLFDELVSMPEAKRAGFIEACGANAETRALLVRLVAQDEDASRVGSFDGDHRSLPTRFGPYQVDRLLAEGGMGRVLLASRDVDGVRQQVAIKQVRRERLDESARVRLRLERQVLALLNHPNIAAMLDIGEDEQGDPYLVMEYVAGDHLDGFVRRSGAGIRARVLLFRQVASAIAHAHRNLIVHRDIKGSNVLIDAHGTVKVIDFGIAKPMRTELGSLMVADTATAQRFLSPVSAAPEQWRGLPVTPACDVYGLGALLHELIAETPVFDLTGLAPSEAERLVLERDPDAPTVRRNRSDASFRVDKDLDAITLKCLRKDPLDRYATVDHLIDDLDAWLEERPVVARRGGAWYRFQRFTKRRWKLLAVAATLFAVVSVATWVNWQSIIERDRHEQRAASFSNLLLDSIQAADPGRGNLAELKVRDLFSALADRAVASDATAVEDRADLIRTLAEIQIRLGQYERATSLLNALAVPDPEETSAHAAHMLLAASLASAQTKYDEADRLLMSAVAVPGTDLANELKLAKLRLAYDRGEFKTIVPELEAMANEKLPFALENRRLLLIADAEQQQYRFKEARARYDEVLARLDQGGAGHRSAKVPIYRTTILLATRMEDLEYADDQLAAARELVTTLYGADSLAGAGLHQSEYLVAEAKGDKAAALVAAQASLDGYRRHIGESTSQVAKAHFNLASTFHTGGRKEDAYHHYESAIEIADRIWLPSDGNRFLFRLAYASQRAVDGDLKAGGDIIRPALSHMDQTPELKEFDIYPFALLLDAAGRYADDPNATSKQAVVDALMAAQEGAQWKETKEALSELSVTLERLGISATH